MSPRPSLRDLTGATLIRFESADGCSYNVNAEEAERRIGFGDVRFRGMPGNVSGDMVIPFLYLALRLDPHRYVFDLPSTVTGTGSSRTGAGANGGGSREGYVFERGKPDHPVGKIYFLTHDRRFSERDPEDRRDFEMLG